MKPTVLVLALVFVAACTPIPPVSPPTDASDASVMTYDGAFASTPCGKACSAMQSVGCVVMSDCQSVLESKTSARLLRNAVTGDALKCEDLATVTTVAQVQAVGQPCGPMGKP